MMLVEFHDERLYNHSGFSETHLLILNSPRRDCVLLYLSCKVDNLPNYYYFECNLKHFKLKLIFITACY
jgi:hypothetical protein